MWTNSSGSYDEENCESSSGSFSSTDSRLEAVLSSDMLKHFEIVKKIGEGAYGSVYKIKSKTDKKEYALKFVPLRTDQDEERINREVEVLSQLQHANIVRYHTSWHIKSEGASNDSLATNVQYLCIQMEYCNQTLRDFIENMKVYDRCDRELEQRRILGEIVDGIKYIHDENIMHRDLNPRNIFLSKSGTVKIGDFGIARPENLTEGSKIMSSKDENLTSYIGTKLYCGPEVLNCDKKYDKRIDLYSLGLIIFEMWFTFQTVMERCKIFEGIKSPAIVIPDSFEPQIVKDIIVGLLQHDPNKRMGLEEVVDKISLFNEEETFTDETPIQQIPNRSGFDLKGSVGRLIYMHSTSKKQVKGSCFRLGSGPFIVTSYSVVKRRKFPQNWYAFFGRKNKKAVLKPKNPIWTHRDLDIAILELEVNEGSYLPGSLSLQNQDVTQKVFTFRNINNAKSLMEIADWPSIPENPADEMIIKFESSSNRGAPVLYVSDQNVISVFGIVLGHSFRKGVKEKGMTVIRNLSSVYESIDPIMPAYIRKAIFSSSPYFKCHERIMENIEHYIMVQKDLEDLRLIQV